MTLLLLLACGDQDEPLGPDAEDGDTAAPSVAIAIPGEPDPVDTGPFDHDGDGYSGASDCDDARADVHPGAADAWHDGIDADCAGDDDFDADGDGIAAPEGGGADCDDEDRTTFPGGLAV